MPAEPATPTNDIDTMIREMWSVCMLTEEADTLRFSAASDMWWGVKVECAHGRYRSVSDGPLDLSTAFQRLHAVFVEAHSE